MSLRLKNVKKTFSLKTGDVEVLRDIDLEIQDGDFISIVGPSGCGKKYLAEKSLPDWMKQQKGRSRFMEKAFPKRRSQK